MTNDRKDEAPAGSAEEWPKRAPPTIDLDASEVSGDTRAAGGANARPFFHRLGGGFSASHLSMLAAPLAGAVAALLVIAAALAFGLIGPHEVAQPAVSPSQFENVAANVGDLTARLTRVEAGAAKSSAPASDLALAQRTEALEKSLAAAQDEVARLNTQLRATTSSLNELKAAPRDGAAVAPADLGPLTERLAQLEDTTRALASEVRKPNAAAQDINVRRLLVANTLDVAVRRGEAFAGALAAAKQVAADPNSLAPLDAFAARGIPSEASLLREVVPVLQRIADGNQVKPKAADADKPSAGTSVLDRLQSGLFSLVRIERDTGQPVSASPPPMRPSDVSAHDLAAARRDIASLPQAGDPAVQAWIKAVDARTAALAAAQKFSAEALAAFGKSGQ